MTYTATFPIQFAPFCQEDAQIFGPNVRFSVLTPRLLRLEYSPSESFEDRPSQVFWYRHQPVPQLNVRRNADLIAVETDHLLLQYRPSARGFSANSLSVALKNSGAIWRYGQPDPLNLEGTARTLDDKDGAVPLEKGLVSRSGWSVWDDSTQLLFDAEGWLTPRIGEGGYQDLYFFGYGADYYACLRDFSEVAGHVPMLPRWAFGNWWSRYWPYSAVELLALMDEFKARQVPLSVCIVDMDWHIVDTGNNSSGWTGYTWNSDLFPDPPGFIASLHVRGLKTALNLHPAEGVHPHEEQYPAVAEQLGVDPDSMTPIPFAIDDPKFTRAYFEHLHHPYEEQGIDFWWLDWQQGSLSGLPGLDPLWWLNHLHFYDLAREDKKNPFIFSRWGGLGNHRYPIGFSGDTHVSWESLAFQPYFTATAANVNYGWWSHDIGGHMSGVEDPELYARWIQFGVFSPILRLHATNNPYHERRPWGYDAETERAASAALRLRHSLIPYLQSMAWRNHMQSIPLILPMYYAHPHDEQAYHCPDQYLFGSELVVAPFTSPADPETRLCRQVIWLPPGLWFDFFRGDLVSGAAWHAVYGDLDDIPVFARAGAIVPLQRDLGWDGDNSPGKFKIHLFPGAARSFELFDDEGSASGSLTTISHDWRESKWTVQIDPPSGTVDSQPTTRTYEIWFRGINADASLAAELNGADLKIDCDYDQATKSLRLAPIKVDAREVVALTLRTENDSLLADDDRHLLVARKMLQAFRMNTNVKLRLASQLPHILQDPALLAAYQFTLTKRQLRALAELVTGSGVHRLNRRAGEEEEIILWNNQSSDLVHHVFAAAEVNGLAASRSGPVPPFAVITVGSKRLSYQTGSQPALGRATIPGWFAALIDRIPRDQLSDLAAIIQFEIGGKSGYNTYLVVEDGEISLHEGVCAQPNVTITADSEQWLAFINGDRTPEEMFLSGAIQIGGNFALLAGLVDAFSFSPVGQYTSENWRLDISYLDFLTIPMGET